MKPSRSISPPGTYFVTFSTFQRRRLFVAENYAKLFLKTLYSHNRDGAFLLHAFVVMPEHVHLLITPASDKSLERVLQLIKGGYSHEFGLRFGQKKEVWQRGFTDHRIRDAADFALHRGYIHNNPVKRGLVTEPAEYRFCSAFPGFRLDHWPSAAKAVTIKHLFGTTEVVPFP
jgi:putative transposase